MQPSQDLGRIQFRAPLFHQSSTIRYGSMTGAGLDPQDIPSASPQQLIEAFTPLARRAAVRWGDNTEDDRADALLGLAKAAQSYEPSKGPFAAWAAMYTRQAVTRGRHKRLYHIPLPVDTSRMLRNLPPAERANARRSVPRVHCEPDPQHADTSAVPPADAGAEEVISILRGELRDELPESLIKEIKFWIHHDGGDKTLRHIARSAKKLLRDSSRAA